MLKIIELCCYNNQYLGKYWSDCYKKLTQYETLYGKYKNAIKQKQHISTYAVSHFCHGNIYAYQMRYDFVFDM